MTGTITGRQAYHEAEQALWARYGVEPEDRTVELPDLDVAVRLQQTGTGEPIVFLHGSPTSGTTFAPLAGLLTDFRCVIPDLPPGGLSPEYRVTPATAPALFSRILIGILDALDIDRAHVVASSSGSAFAFKAAARAPERIGRSVHLGAPGLVGGMPIPASEKLLLIPGVARLVSAMTPGPKTQVSMMKSIGHGESIEAGRIPDEYWAWYAALMRETDTFTDQIRMLPSLKGRGLGYSHDVEVSQTELAGQGPTLLIWGSEEALASESDARALVDRMPDATLEVVSGAGHLPWLDFPDAVATSVRRFLGGTG